MLRGQRYRLVQIRRIVLAALEHLHIPADARAMEVFCNGSGQGLVVVVFWDFDLPQLEAAALSQYIQSKVTAITGLRYDHQRVLFEPTAPALPELTDQHVSSWWLRERIHRLTSPRSRRRRLRNQSEDSTVVMENHEPRFDRQTAPPADSTTSQIMELREMLRKRRSSSADGSLRAAQEPHKAIVQGYLTVHADLHMPNPMLDQETV